MNLFSFGNTGLKVTRFGLGLAALGRPGYINLGHGEDLDYNYDYKVMSEKASEVLDEAYKKGIKYFDAARSYGRAELFLSEWIENKDDERITIGSKWGYKYTADWKVKAEKHEVKEHSLDMLTKQWPESRTLLGKYLKIYHIHSATLESGVLENPEVLEKLWELKKQGIVVGLSLSGEKQNEILEKALLIKRGEEILFQSVQATWNVLEQSATNALEKASAKGCGIIVKETVANGRLTNRNKDSRYSQKLKLLQEMAEKYGTGPDALSIAYILKQPWVSVVLCGATTVEQLRSNLEASDINLSNEDVSILAGLAESPQIYWEERSKLQWN